jgi:hypothetical protein
MPFVLIESERAVESMRVRARGVEGETETLATGAGTVLAARCGMVAGSSRPGALH